MGKIRDASKERYWRKLIGRQGKTGETVARFCAREGVPVHQFYWWQRTLRGRDGQSTRVGAARHEIARPDAMVAKSFVPVRLPFLTYAPIEVVHPAGCVVRVPAAFDPRSLRQVLTTLDRCTSDTAES